MSKFKKIIRIAFVLALLALFIVPAVRLLSYNQQDNSSHLAQKKSYLETLSDNAEHSDRPNIVLILLDDLGYGDVGAYGAQSIATPHIDSLAEAGTRFSHYYSPSSVCSPSRAAMLTGRYPPRAGLSHVVFPEGHLVSNGQKVAGVNTRIPAEEIMLSEVLNAVGYNTGMVGKWHMGDIAPSLPNDFGFDSYYGSHYSNDMAPFPLYRNNDIEEPAELDQTRMHGLYTREVVSFIEQQDASTPFFLYYAHNFPHIPLYSSPAQAGKSDAGLYGDVVEDIDNSIGALLQALDSKGFTDDTLIIFTSDNGPWYQGNPGFVRGRKNQTWEGGQRVPFIVQWPGRVTPGMNNSTPISGVDLFPTILRLLHLAQPNDRVIDGVDISALLLDVGTLPERPLFYYAPHGTTVEAVRDARFKYHRPRGVRAQALNGSIDMKQAKGPWLFDLASDPQESYDVSSRYPQELQRLQKIIDARAADMAANPRGWLTVK